MKSKTLCMVILSVTAIVFLFYIRPNLTFAQINPGNHASPRWEYKITHAIPNEQEFDALGRDGWELCVGMGPYPTNNVPVTFIFKRTIVPK